MPRAFISLLCLLCLLPAAFAKSKNTTPEDIETQAPPSLAEPTIIRKEQTLDKLPESITQKLNKYKISPEDLSIYIRDINADRPLISHNADVLRSPASTMKLITTYAALKTLGPNYTWQTEAWMRGEFKDGTLDGDLILKGYGDPFLVNENFWKFVHALRDKGLKEITGNIIIDNSYFDLPNIDPGAFDQEPHRVYNAQPSALMFNFQATRFLFKPDKEKTVTVKPFPLFPHSVLTIKLNMQKADVEKVIIAPKFRFDDQGILNIKGRYSNKCGQNFILRVLSTPDEHIYNAFTTFWEELNGKYNGAMLNGTVKEGDTRFHISSSDTLGEQIRLINKWSNNVMTRQLLLTMGAKKYGAPGTLEKGRTAILETLKENDVSTQGIFIDNGSGLTRNGKLSARQLGNVLENAYRDTIMPEYIASLSISGKDGTLARRFNDEDLAGRSHLKTGTLKNVTSIAGYMLNRKGKRMILVIQQNGSKTGKGRGVALQNAIVRWVFEQ